jgi:LDH2 family malate/lactate/ureidoglycolate dehydrogenase
MDNWIKRFRGAKAQPGKQVNIPGDFERITEAERLENGIPLIQPVVKDLMTLASEMNLRWIS